MMRQIALATTGALMLGSVPDEKLNLLSEFSAIKAVRLSQLPGAPRSDYQDEGCLKQLSISPTTAGGRLAIRRGWHVFGERTLKGTTAAVIASGVGPGPSGLCLVQDGNIALFRGAQVLGVFYPANNGGSSGRGSVANGIAALDDHRLRVSDEASTYADLVFADDRITLARPGPEQRACGQGVTVPAILAHDMNAARAMLRAGGWRPILKAERPGGISPVANKLRDKGWCEVDGCAGTGLGLCRFRYRKKGVELSVESIGEQLAVSNYRLVCQKRR